MEFDHLLLQKNTRNGTFELVVEGQTSFIHYREEGKTVHLLHTEVPREMEGKGVAGALVEKTFCYLQKNDLRIKPLCSYVQSYLKRHPEWEHLVEKAR